MTNMKYEKNMILLFLILYVFACVAAQTPCDPTCRPAFSPPKKFKREISITSPSVPLETYVYCEGELAPWNCGPSSGERPYCCKCEGYGVCCCTGQGCPGEECCSSDGGKCVNKASCCNIDAACVNGVCQLCSTTGSKCTNSNTCCSGNLCLDGVCKYCESGVFCGTTCCPSGHTCQSGKCVCDPSLVCKNNGQCKSTSFGGPGQCVNGCCSYT